MCDISSGRESKIILFNAAKFDAAKFDAAKSLILSKGKIKPEFIAGRSRCLTLSAVHKVVKNTT